MKEKKESKKRKREPSELSKAKDKIKDLKNELKSLKDEKLRVHAEFENSKKRINQQRIEDRKFASKYLIDELLTPMLQLDKIVHMETDDAKLKNFLIGFQMIKNELLKILYNDGLKEIDAKDKDFDPKYHEAVEKVSNKEFKNGINIEVIEKGYIYKEKLLRPAKVKVNEWRKENGKDE